MHPSHDGMRETDMGVEKYMEGSNSMRRVSDDVQSDIFIFIVGVDVRDATAWRAGKGNEATK